MSKLISINNELYDLLLSLKKENESFSKVILKLVEKSSNNNEFMVLKGIAKEEDFDKETYKLIKEGWKRWSKRYV